MSRPTLAAAALLLVSACALIGCVMSPQERIRGKLYNMVDEDLAAITNEVGQTAPSALLARPYYRIVGYKVTPNSGSYSHICEVHFYYLKAIRMKQVRKYRYNPEVAAWERYYKQVVHDWAGA